MCSSLQKICVSVKKYISRRKLLKTYFLRTKNILKLLVQIYVVVYLLVRFVLVRPILLRKIGLALRPYHIYSSFLSSSYVNKDRTYPIVRDYTNIWSRRDVIILLYYSFSGYILLIVIKIYYIYHIHSNIYIYQTHTHTSLTINKICVCIYIARYIKYLVRYGTV